MKKRVPQTSESFFRCGFGPRGRFWKHVIPMGFMKPSSIRSRVQHTSNGRHVIIEGFEESIIEGVKDEDMFRKSIELPSTVDEEKLQVRFKRAFGGAIVVFSERKTKRFDKETPAHVTEPERQAESLQKEDGLLDITELEEGDVIIVRRTDKEKE